MKLKRSSIFIKIVVVALIAYAIVSLIGTKDKIAVAREDQQTLQAQVDTVMQQNAELSYDIEHAGDDETVEEIARTKLGLVKPGEKIFYDIGN